MYSKGSPTKKKKGDSSRPRSRQSKFADKLVIANGNSCKNSKVSGRNKTDQFRKSHNNVAIGNPKPDDKNEDRTPKNPPRLLSLFGSKTNRKQPKLKDLTCKSHNNVLLDKEGSDSEEDQLLRVISSDILGYDREDEDKRKNKNRRRTFSKSRGGAGT